MVRASLIAAVVGLAVAGPVAAQSLDPVREIGGGDNPPRVVFECTHTTMPPQRMEMVLRRMAGQVWAYSSLDRGVDCSSLSTGGITCMADVPRGRGVTLQGALNDLLKDEEVRCARVQ